MTDHGSTVAGASQRPGRVTLGQVVEMLLQRTGGEHSSVTLTRNSKGETQIEVVVRTAEAGEVTTPDAALAKAMELYESARARYPMASGFVGAQPDESAAAASPIARKRAER